VQKVPIGFILHEVKTYQQLVNNAKLIIKLYERPILFNQSNSK